MYAVMDSTLRVVDLSDFHLNEGENNECTILVKYEETIKDGVITVVAYDGEGNKYNASQPEIYRRCSFPLIAKKTPIAALQMKQEKVVNFNDFKRAKEERTATKKEKFNEALQQFKNMATHKLEKLFEL